MKNELLDIINNLPSEEKTVINLYYGINGINLQHSIKSIALLLDKSESTIKRIKRKALQDIKEKLFYEE